MHRKQTEHNHLHQNFSHGLYVNMKAKKNVKVISEVLVKFNGLISNLTIIFHLVVDGVASGWSKASCGYPARLIRYLAKPFVLLSSGGLKLSRDGVSSPFTSCRRWSDSVLYRSQHVTRTDFPFSQSSKLVEWWAVILSLWWTLIWIPWFGFAVWSSARRMGKKKGLAIVQQSR